MELVSLCPFPAELLLWEADAGNASLTVVVKVTLRLVHEADAVVAEEQIPIGGDEAWDDNPVASIFQPSDRAPLKPRTDLILVGHAYAPNGRPVERLVAQMKVGDFSKSVTVSGARLWLRSGTGFAPGPTMPFEKMPLRYERGALTQDNPVGADPTAPPLEGAPVAPVLAPVAPATSPCFGPIAATWRPRRRLLGEAGRFWTLAFETAGRGPSEPAPRALDFRFFNAAPPDQQTSLLRQRADIELINLNPMHATLRTRLPALRPQVFRVNAPGGRAVEVALRCDTLWLDSDRGIACLVWRGLTDVPSMDPASVGTVIVVADPQGRRVRYEQVERAWREGIPIEATEPAALDALSQRHDAIKSRGDGDGGSTDAEGKREGRDETRAFGPEGGPPVRATLPFAPGAPVPFSERTMDLRSESASQTGTPFGGARDAGDGAGTFSGRLAEIDFDVETTHSGDDDLEPASAPQPLPMLFVERPAMLAIPAPSTPPPPPLSVPKPPPMPVESGVRKSEPPKAGSKSLPPSEAGGPGIDPKDVPIATYGSVSAELMIKRGERARVLEAHEFSEPMWARIHAYWTAEMGRETARGESKLLAKFDFAYVETMGVLRKPIGVPEYAAILVAIERGAVDKQLATLSLSLSDLMRVQRVWTRKVADDPELGKTLGKAVEEARAAGKPSA